MKQLKNQIIQKDKKIDSFTSIIVELQKREKINEYEIKKIQNDLTQTKEEKKELEEKLKNISGLSLQNVSIYLIDKKDRFIYPNKKGNYTTEINDIRVTFTPKSEIKQEFKIKIHCAFPTAEQPPKPFCEDCLVTIPERGIGVSQTISIKECFKNFEFITSDYRISIIEVGNEKILYDEQMFRKR